MQEAGAGLVPHLRGESVGVWCRLLGLHTLVPQHPTTCSFSDSPITHSLTCIPRSVPRMIYVEPPTWHDCTI